MRMRKPTPARIIPIKAPKRIASTPGKIGFLATAHPAKEPITVPAVAQRITRQSETWRSKLQASRGPQTAPRTAPALAAHGATSRNVAKRTSLLAHIHWEMSNGSSAKTPQTAPATPPVTARPTVTSRIRNGRSMYQERVCRYLTPEFCCERSSQQAGTSLRAVLLTRRPSQCLDRSAAATQR